MGFLNRFLRSAEQRLAGLPLPCAVRLAGGPRIGSSQPHVVFVVRDTIALVHLAHGAIGRLAEDYVEGRLEIEGEMRDLMAIAPALLGVDPALESGGWLPRLVRRTQRLLWERAHHSRANDSRQIRHHYDVSDDFYGLWLDPRRVYSCAYFADAAMSLSEAQEAKLDLLCKKLMLRPGERFIDIGAGWGGLLLWAAEHYGVDATGITLSTKQHAYVNALIEQKGLQGRVRMLLQDYRDVDESLPFDRVASVGMCEHVGRPNLPAYFAKIHRLLKPGGLLINHSVTAGGTDNPQPDGGMSDFIEKYIFPGGQLVHVSAMLNAMTRGKLEPLDAECLRPHYAQTLWRWADALEAHLDEAYQVLGKDANKAIRAYRLYLAGSAMGFERGWTSVFQVLASRPDHVVEQPEQSWSHLRGTQCMYPFNRAYVYAQGDEHVGIARGGDDNKSGGASERANRKAVRDEYNALHTE
ncbi:cyclopropane-fatty-acyl-phospholipid synthase [Caballeronia choica]|jgi:cyclopropane-fatty-acyl-phospholipid synthase|uniref:Cyclopropane-fatty-acyl-phospholipid synthase n=1 Tax=Caballeronia choica TaxID=326476 RepID=A0A158KS05_9BURK|nr:class I SAM-dependent methyltransferase [Caballeronia choica]SAL83902.1 cyclopropane-fatty-acyl-phospholipid synthase [Caballeronia choica]